MAALELRYATRRGRWPVMHCVVNMKDYLRWSACCLSSVIKERWRTYTWRTSSAFFSSSFLTAFSWFAFLYHPDHSVSEIKRHSSTYEVYVQSHISRSQHSLDRTELSRLLHAWFTHLVLYCERCDLMTVCEGFDIKAMFPLVVAVVVTSQPKQDSPEKNLGAPLRF